MKYAQIQNMASNHNPLNQSKAMVSHNTSNQSQNTSQKSPQVLYHKQIYNSSAQKISNPLPHNNQSYPYDIVRNGQIVRNTNIRNSHCNAQQQYANIHQQNYTMVHQSPKKTSPNSFDNQLITNQISNSERSINNLPYLSNSNIGNHSSYIHAQLSPLRSHSSQKMQQSQSNIQNINNLKNNNESIYKFNISNSNIGPPSLTIQSMGARYFVNSNPRTINIVSSNNQQMIPTQESYNNSQNKGSNDINIDYSMQQQNINQNQIPISHYAQNGNSSLMQKYGQLLMTRNPNYQSNFQNNMSQGKNILNSNNKTSANISKMMGPQFYNLQSCTSDIFANHPITKQALFEAAIEKQKLANRQNQYILEQESQSNDGQKLRCEILSFIELIFC